MRRLITVCLIVISAIFFASNIYAMRAENIQRTDNAAAGQSQSEIRIVTEPVERIKGNILYTKRSSYDLRGVRVVDRPGDSKGQKKRVAEMIFINGVLNEVVLH